MVIEGRPITAADSDRYADGTHRDFAAQQQPDPQPGRHVVADYVLADIQARVEAGREKYGTVLMSHNGRDPLWDAYQEAIDLVFYLRQALIERDDSGQMKALAYYKAAALQCGRSGWPRPMYVPKRVRVSSIVRGFDSCVLPGEYDAVVNQYGAVSVRTKNGDLLGLQLNEFDVVEWCENSHLD